MGDRISIQFQKGEEQSVCFFSHWDGRCLLRAVKTYHKKLLEDIKKAAPKGEGPIERFEPNTVMVDFISWYMEQTKLYHKDRFAEEAAKKRPDKSHLRYHQLNVEHVTGNYYLGATEMSGDNSDNGNFVFDLDTGTFPFEHEFDDL